MMKPAEVQNVFHMSDGTREKVKEITDINYNIGEILEVISGPFAGQDGLLPLSREIKFLVKSKCLVGQSLPKHLQIKSKQKNYHEHQS